MKLRVEYHRPRSLEEACALKAKLPEAAWIAGGTDLLLRVKHGTQSSRSLISLRGLGELAGLELREGARIGSGTRLADILRDEAVRARFPVLAQAVATMGSVQVRNVATLGGNVCRASPCADTAPPLLVLGARLRLRGTDGEREVPVEDFFVGPGETAVASDELLTEILVDDPPSGSRGAFLSRGRVRVDLSLASVAVLVEMESDGATCRRARVAAGAVAPTPLRLPAVEAHLEGARLDRDVVARAGELARDGVKPISDVRASADYRRHVTGVMVKRALRACLDGETT